MRLCARILLFWTLRFLFDKMANRNAILIRPHWTATNSFSLPILSEVNGKNTVRGSIGIAVPVLLFLDSLWDETAGHFQSKRSIVEDQLQVFKTAEMLLGAMGVDGKACLLRTICEIQNHPIGEISVVGAILTALLTPKYGDDEFLRDYLEAERVGQLKDATIDSCGDNYPKCPMSLFNLFEDWSQKHTNDKPLPIYADGVRLHYSGGADMDEDIDKVPLEAHYLMHID
ncbi:uncharacterized protein LOC136028423 [Artemia franciscana]|uniref:uncharacterized protein LOC136028423 n=1 Tax=Artemia franciscana TaxID=6661 RepID=UPI0032DA9A7E